MKTEDFYKTLSDYTDTFHRYGFMKKTKKTYVSRDNIKLEFVLDKWGWNPDEGARFVIRLYDLERVVDSLGNILPDDQIDIKPSTLIQAKKINKKDIHELTKDLPEGVEKSFMDGYWYVYYDENNLREVLDRVLPPILEETKKWTASRQEARKQTVEVRSMSSEDIEALRKKFSDSPK